MNTSEFLLQVGSGEVAPSSEFCKVGSVAHVEILIIAIKGCTSPAGSRHRDGIWTVVCLLHVDLDAILQGEYLGAELSVNNLLHLAALEFGGNEWVCVHFFLIGFDVLCTHGMENVDHFLLGWIVHAFLVGTQHQDDEVGVVLGYQLLA